MISVGGIPNRTAVCATGASVPAPKPRRLPRVPPPARRRQSAFRYSGSLVAGDGRAKVTAAGARSEIGKIGSRSAESRSNDLGYRLKPGVSTAGSSQ